eukprot:PhM_4_TR12681/c0_g1_i1/m.17149
MQNVPSPHQQHSFWENMSEISRRVPGLSIDFRCTEADAQLLRNTLCSLSENLAQKEDELTHLKHEQQQQRQGEVRSNNINADENNGLFHFSASSLTPQPSPPPPAPLQQPSHHPLPFYTQHSREFVVMEEKMARLESDIATLKQRLEKKSDEVDRLKGQVTEARNREDATAHAHKDSIKVVSLRCEQLRKQLLNEESRNSKLEQKERVMVQEIDRLKQQLHKALMR